MKTAPRCRHLRAEGRGRMRRLVSPVRRNCPAATLAISSAGTQTASARRLIRVLYISRPVTVQSAVFLYLAIKEELQW